MTEEEPMKFEAAYKAGDEVPSNVERIDVYEGSVGMRFCVDVEVYRGSNGTAFVYPNKPLEPTSPPVMEAYGGGRASIYGTHTVVFSKPRAEAKAGEGT